MTTHLIKIVNALIDLRKSNIMSIADISGINYENLNNFLKGNNIPLKRENLRLALVFLGVIDGRMSSTNHHWHINGKIFGNKDENYASLKYAAGMIKEGQLTEIIYDKDKNKSVFLIAMNNGARIYIVDQHGVFNSSQVLVTLGKTVNNKVEVSDQVWRMIINGDLSDNEYDMVVEGDGALRGWQDVRVIASEYGVSPKDIIAWTINKSKEKLHDFKLELVVDNDKDANLKDEYFKICNDNQLAFDEIDVYLKNRRTNNRL